MDDKAKTNKKSLKDKDICDIELTNKKYTKKCVTNNKEQLNIELENRLLLEKEPNDNQYLYPTLDDPYFNIKIANKQEFSDAKYDGAIYDVEQYSNILKTAEYELLPQQAFVRNFLSFQTPYNSLLLYHGLGSGKTCSAIGVCEEMRDYLKQMGINKRIIIVASPNVQDNFRLQLFDERKLKEVDGIWTTKGCLGNKMLKEINPTGMKGLKREKVIQQVKNLINSSYSFQGYVQFSNEIVRKSGKPDDKIETKIRNLENEYANSLIVIDEVHNIRISDDNENKNVAKNLMFLVSVVSNIRLLLLSATPMFNSYKEIVWLLNLLNMNDRRGIVAVSDIFDKNGDWKKDKDGKEIGKEILIRKATGYISYVRGENPYTFPFRVYPDRFAPKNTFQSIDEYPKYQINGRKIPDNKKIQKLSLFLTNIGSYQELGYKYIVDRLRNRRESIKTTKKGTQRKVVAFSSLKSFGYTDLHIPIEALNIVYPYVGLEQHVDNLEPFEFIDEDEEEIDDISPALDMPEKEIIEEIDDVISSGPKILHTTNKVKATKEYSELESEPAITEGIEADVSMIDKVVEADTRNINKKQISNKKSKKSNLIFDIIEEDINEEEATNVNKDGFDGRVKDVSPNEISFKGTLVPKEKQEGTHIIEGDTTFNRNKNDNNSLEGGSNTYSNSDTNSNSKSSSRINGLLIDPKDLTGIQGLKRIMEYTDTKTPAMKGSFEYRKGVPHVFKPDEIGKYSAKIKNICDYIYNENTGEVADGIIAIYSTFIDAGIIPIALALEEMGFTRYGEKAKPLFKNPPTPVVDVRTMKPPSSKKDFKPARYIMITGDSRISPNNDADVKAITSNDNLYEEDEDGNIKDITGQKIKVVLISQAGSEGLDFKCIRQVHILEPWYNVNRIEQIIGRAVRNFSHKDLPFSKRNVQIFQYGTLLKNAEEESVDLYVYRMAEIKAVKIGKVTRVMKQISVDCVINHEQTELIASNFEKIEENRNIKQDLSDHQMLSNFVIGDMDNSATCDFMECEFKCLPETSIEASVENTNTYTENFMLLNSEKIIQKIKVLMKMRHFYKKNDLIKLINVPKKYPMSQIYAALTQIINDNTEYIVDKYGRTGYLINIDEYYLFQPSELNYKNISIRERSVPIDYKHNMVKFEIKTNAVKPVIDKRGIENMIIQDEIDENLLVKGQEVLNTMYSNYKLALDTNKVDRGNDNWYQLCGVVMRKMMEEDNIVPAQNTKERLEILEEFLIEHIVDSLMMDEKIELLNYIYSKKNNEQTIYDSNDNLKRFYGKIKKYLLSKLLVSKGITGLLAFNGQSRTENLNLFVLDNNQWLPAKPEDKRDLEEAIIKKYKLKRNFNRYVGFIGFESNRKYMVYQVKDTTNDRSTGFRCDQSGKEKIINVLNDIEMDDRFASKVTKDGSKELCVRQEFTLRSYERQKLENKTWFLDTETAIINEFQKKDKKK